MSHFMFKPSPLEQNNQHVKWAGEIRTKLLADGHRISLHTCLLAWEAYSESVCAGWINHEDLCAKELLFNMGPWLVKV